MIDVEFKKFRKVPVVVEAYQTDKELNIETLEGIMRADKGDWIIRGIKGELYPCKDDIFRKTYTEVSDRFQVCFVPKIFDDDKSHYCIEDKYESVIELFEFEDDEGVKILLDELCDMLNTIQNRLDAQQKEIDALKWVKEYILKGDDV